MRSTSRQPHGWSWPGTALFLRFNRGTREGSVRGVTTYRWESSGLRPAATVLSIDSRGSELSSTWEVDHQVIVHITLPAHPCESCETKTCCNRTRRTRRRARDRERERERERRRECVSPVGSLFPRKSKHASVRGEARLACACERPTGHGQVVCRSLYSSALRLCPSRHSP